MSVLQSLSQPLLGVGNYYWRKAFDKLADNQQVVFEASQPRKLDVLTAVLRAAEDARQRCLHKQWKSNTATGKIIVVRDVLEKIAGWIDRFKAVGDAAVQAKPEIASLAWAGVRFLLTVIQGDVQLFGSMVIGLEKITSLMYRFKVLEDFRLQGTSPFFQPFRGCSDSAVIRNPHLVIPSH